MDDHELPRGNARVNNVGEADDDKTCVNTQSPMNKIQPGSTNVDNEHTLNKLKERRDREPLFFCKIVTRWPLQSFLLTLAAHLLMILISGALLASGYDLLPIDFANLPLEINDQPWRPRDLAWTSREEFDTYYNRKPVLGYRASNYKDANIDLYYDAGRENIFSKEKLQKIKIVEDSLTSVSEYQNNYCKLNASFTGCDKPFSVIRYFDGTFSSVNAVFDDPNFDNIVAVLYEAYTNAETKENFLFFLGKDHEITSTKAYSSITRSTIAIGYPLEGYPDDKDFDKIITLFSVQHMKPILAHVRENYDEFDFSYRSNLIWMEDVFTQAMKDAMWALGSMCFIFCLILLHTQSLWIAGFAIFSIMSCFVITNLIYRTVLDFRYLGFFHVPTLFIGIGIGADDIFVFYDVWRNTACEEYKSLAQRLSDCYRKTAFSMLFTSLTTSVAFFASAISPLLATRSFGVFSGIVVIMNYLSVIIYFPTVVIMYHTKFEKFKWPCISFFKRHLRKIALSAKEKILTKIRREKQFSDKNGTPPNSTKTSDINSSENAGSTNRNMHDSIARFRNSLTTQLSIIDTEMENRSDDTRNPFGIDKSEFVPITIQRTTDKQKIIEGKATPKKTKKKSFMVRFFSDRYSKIVTHKIMRFVILAVMATLIILFTVQTSRLEPDNEGLKILKDSHVYRIAEKHAVKSFYINYSTLILYIVWGMNPNDMSDCHFSKPNCLGKRDWDSTFNPSTPEAQIAVKNLCDTMLNWTPDQASEYRVLTNSITGEYEIDCYIHSLDTFLKEESASTGSDWNLTFDYTKTLAFMNARTTYYNTSGFTSDYEHYLEIPISYWLSNKYSYIYTDDFKYYNDIIGESTGDFTTTLKTDSSRKYGNDIRYVGIEIITSLSWPFGYAEGQKIMHRWEDFVNNEMTKMPNGMKNGFQTTNFFWHWLVVSEMLVKNALYGIIIGVSLALPILIIATRNIITGCLATFTICCSTICVIGVIPLGGWKLGVLESLYMCIVVGLAVDYVVHLAEGYTLSLYTDRYSRVRDMLDTMAVSVFFGACTTLGASFFMFATELSIFFNFGIFMFSTIGFSLFFSMGMFVTLMGLFGPQGDTGNVVVLFKKLRNSFKNKRLGDWFKNKRIGDWFKNKLFVKSTPSDSQAELVAGNTSSQSSLTSVESINIPSNNDITVSNLI